MDEEDYRNPLYRHIINFETGGTGKPYKPKWDYKLTTGGYGTPYRAGIDLTDKSVADREMRTHVQSKESEILKRFPHLSKPEHRGKLLALTDLSYNAGTGAWADKGLGKAVGRGDWDDAKNRFLQYTRAGGEHLPGLKKRRSAGLRLWDGGAASEAASGGAGGQDMSWLDWLQGNSKNAAGAAREGYEGSVARDPNGVISGLKSQLPQEAGPELDILRQIAGARRAGIEGYAPPKPTGLETIGMGLQALAIPVSFAQGNSTYGNALAQNNEMTRHISGRQKAQERMNDLSLSINDEMLTGAGNFAMGVLGKEREKKAAARQRAREAVTIYGKTREGYEAAAGILRSAGLTEDAAQVERLIKDDEGAQQSAPASPQEAQPSGVPGIVVEPPTPLEDVVAQGVAPPAERPITEGGLPDDLQAAQDEVESLSAARNRAAAIGDEETAKALQTRIDGVMEASGLKSFKTNQSSARVKRAFDEGETEGVAGFKDKKQMADVSKGLRAEYTKATTDYKNMSEMYNKIESSRERALAGSPQAQMSLIFGFMKMLDPGSVVREGEYANAEDTVGIPGYVRNAFNKALSGQKIAPEQVEGFLTEAESIIESQRSSYERYRDIYRGMATRLGLDPEDVIPEFFPKRVSTKEDKDSKVEKIKKKYGIP